MAIDIFEPLKDLQGNKLKSASWYRNAVSLITDRSSPSELFASGKLLGRPSAGRMSLFFYDPKFKKTLPYYDTFPLVLPLEKYDDGFLGINLHYLPIPLRIRLLDRLVDFSNDTNFDDGTTGQKITILINDANTDFTHHARALNLNGATNWTTSATGDTIEFIYDGDKWYETNRSDNT